MFYPGGYTEDDDDDRNSSGSSDFFSPVSISFFRGGNNNNNNNNNRQRPPQQQNHSRRATATAMPRSGGEVLTPRHDADKSWIGARLSPIGSFDREDRAGTSGSEEDEDEEERHHRALHETMENAPFIVANESTSLLGRLKKQQQQEQQQQAQSSCSDGNSKGTSYNNNNNYAKTHPSRIHPLWDEEQDQHLRRAAENAGYYYGADGDWKIVALKQCLTWGTLVCAVSGTLLVVMGCYDYFFYDYSTTTASDASGDSKDESSDGGNALYNTDPTEVEGAWTWPLFHPSQQALVRLGAFLPQTVFSQQQRYGFSYWRMLSSAFVCSSLVEWVVVLVGWRLVVVANSKSPTWHRWIGVYLSSVFVGQLWTIAWDVGGSSNGGATTTGCVAWGTAGVLCQLGTVRPRRRFCCFLWAASLLVLSLLQRPLGSVWGATGAAFFGWSLAAAELEFYSSSAGGSDPRDGGKRRKSIGEMQELRLAAPLRWLSRFAALAILMTPTLWLAFR